MKIVLASGREIELEVPQTTSDKDYAIFILGVRKSGSTLLNRIWAKAAQHIDMPFVALGGSLFNKDVRAGQWANDPAIAQVFRPGYVYGGFRSAYLRFHESPVFKDAKKILLVRDPRDALVSQYFSTLKTHALPTEGGGTGGASEQMLRQREAAKSMTIDDYVLLSARSFRRTLLEYAPLLDDPNLKLFKYEDVIFEKTPWIQKMLWHAGVTAPLPLVEGLVAQEDVDVIPAVEDQDQFVRKVTPGDHKEKLRPSTIEALTLIFTDPAAKFGYRLK